jgi:hypothetical protein
VGSATVSDVVSGISAPYVQTDSLGKRLLYFQPPALVFLGSPRGSLDLSSFLPRAWSNNAPASSAAFFRFFLNGSAGDRGGTLFAAAGANANLSVTVGYDQGGNVAVGAQLSDCCSSVSTAAGGAPPSGELAAAVQITANGTLEIYLHSFTGGLINHTSTTALYPIPLAISQVRGGLRPL